MTPRWPQTLHQAAKWAQTLSFILYTISQEPPARGLTVTAACVCSTGRSADEHQSGAVPQQPAFHSSDSVTVHYHGCTACWTFPSFCSRDNDHLSCRLCFRWGWVESWFRSCFITTKRFDFSLLCSVSLLLVVGGTLLCTLSGLALFSVLVSSIFNILYITIYNILDYYYPHLTKVRLVNAR